MIPKSVGVMTPKKIGGDGKQGVTWSRQGTIEHQDVGTEKPFNVLLRELEAEAEARGLTLVTAPLVAGNIRVEITGAVRMPAADAFADGVAAAPRQEGPVLLRRLDDDLDPARLAEVLAVKKVGPPLDAQTLETKVFAVHATNALPADGVLHAGARAQVGGGLRNHDGNSFRPTVHFSLGELVRGHKGGDWEHHHFAVLTPLAEVLPQTVNLNPFDTVVLGDFKLPAGTVMVVPEGTTGLPPNVEARTYDPSTTSLREAINQAITARGGLPVRMFMNETVLGVGPAVTPDGTNLNSVEALQPVLDRHPGVRFGVSASHPMIALDLAALSMMDTLDKQPVAPVTLKLWHAATGLLIERMKGDVARRDMPAVSTQTLEEKLVRLEGMRALVKIEIDLRDQHGTSLVGPLKGLSRWLPLQLGAPDEMKVDAARFAKPAGMVPPEAVAAERIVDDLWDVLPALTETELHGLLRSHLPRQPELAEMLAYRASLVRTLTNGTAEVTAQNLADVQRFLLAHPERVETILPSLLALIYPGNPNLENVMRLFELPALRGALEELVIVAAKAFHQKQQR